MAKAKKAAPAPADVDADPFGLFDAPLDDAADPDNAPEPELGLTLDDMILGDLASVSMPAYEICVKLLSKSNFTPTQMLAGLLLRSRADFRAVGKAGIIASIKQNLKLKR